MRAGGRGGGAVQEINEALGLGEDKMISLSFKQEKIRCFQLIPFKFLYPPCTRGNQKDI